MAKDACHRNRTIAPLLEIKVEFVILDILISRNRALSTWSALQTSTGLVFTNSIDSAATQMLSHSLRDCRFLSNTKDPGGRHVVSPMSKAGVDDYAKTSTVDA